MKTSHLRLVTQEHSVIAIVKSSVSSPYGPVRAGLTTSPRTSQVPRLLELLNSLESEAEILSYKSFTAYDTLTTAIEAVRVALSTTATEEAGTDE